MFKETVCFVSMFFGHHTCPDEKQIPVQCTARDGIIICETHAGNERGATHISGSVEKGMSTGHISTANTHLDIVATRKGKVIRTFATEFFPRTIPETRQGVRGRSTFAISVKELPRDAEIAITVHQQPIRQCPHSARKERPSQ